MARHLSLVAALLIRELDYALHDTLLLAVVACDVKDDGITGLETADDALEVRERRDRNTIDARDDFAFEHGLRTSIAPSLTAPRRVSLLREGRVPQGARRTRARTLADRYLHGAALHLAAD